MQLYNISGLLAGVPSSICLPEGFIISTVSLVCAAQEMIQCSHPNLYTQTVRHDMGIDMHTFRLFSKLNLKCYY